MSEWSAKPLNELTTKIGSGATPRGGNSVYTQSGVALIRSQNVLDHTMKNAEIAYISDDAARALNGVTVHEGDVLINITGDSIARCSLVDESVLPARVNQHVSILRTTDEMDPRYLQRYLVNAQMKEYLLSISAGGTRNALTKAQLTELVVRFPQIEEQQAIAEVLAALDDKIAANTRLLETFDAHMLAEYENSASHGVDLVPLGSIAEFHNRRRIPLSARERDARPGKVPYYGASGMFGAVDEALFDERLVLVGEDGSVINPDGTPVVQYIWGPAWVNNHAHILSGSAISTELLFLILSRSQVSHLVTGAVQPKINMGNLKKLLLEIPRDIARLETLVDEETAVTRVLVDENRTLATTRDALLPQLMSGKLRVKDVAEVVGSLA